jgi:hypothetical protein
LHLFYFKLIYLSNRCRFSKMVAGTCLTKVAT